MKCLITSGLLLLALLHKGIALPYGNQPHTSPTELIGNRMTHLQNSGSNFPGILPNGLSSIAVLNRPLKLINAYWHLSEFVGNRTIRTNWVSNQINRQTKKYLLRSGKHEWPVKANSLMVDSLILQSPDTYCRGASPVLTVSGTNVKWYADADKKKLLYQGNTYSSPPLDQTTTFYLTQTPATLESPVQPFTIELVETQLKNVTTTPASCTKNDGIISITATGGTARNPLQYRLDNGPLQNSPVFMNLAAGTYTVTNQVATCFSTKVVTVDHSPLPSITSIDSIAPQCGTSNGSLTIHASGGSSSLSYSLNGVDFQVDNHFSQLGGGVYTITVSDQNQCKISQLISLMRTVNLQIDRVDAVATSCGQTNGQIRVSVGTYNGSVLYSITGYPEQSSPTFTHLAAGSYDVLVKDQTGCLERTTVKVDSSQTLHITQVSMQTANCGMSDGRLIITTNRPSGLQYSVDGQTFQYDSLFSQLSAATYEVMVRDAQNCIATQSISLGLLCEDEVYMPDSFTPNQDGINEGWAIFVPNSSTYLDELSIFNRWGELIFQGIPHLLTNGEVLWNGQYRDQIHAGNYVYRLAVHFSSGATYIYKGRVLLIRE